MRRPPWGLLSPGETRNPRVYPDPRGDYHRSFVTERSRLVIYLAVAIA
jgi:hypothetical protein